MPSIANIIRSGRKICTAYNASTNFAEAVKRAQMEVGL